MANIASLLKEEIIRLARKEIRSEAEGYKKTSAQHRSEMAALKRQVRALEQQLSHLEKAISQNAEITPEPEAENKIRFIAKGFISLRQRLGLTAAEMGKLLDVTGQSIYSWESGKSIPRMQQLIKIAMLRKMGKREVDAILGKTAG